MHTKKITILDIQNKKENHEPITLMTAYDYSSASLVEAAGIDAILVGDSLGMVIMGLENTISVTMEEMLHHCKAVSRGAKHSFLIGDLPFMSYQADPIQAVQNAGRLMKEAGMDSVKLEGGIEMSPTIEKIVNAGIPVMGHIGLTPQSQSKLGGYRIQGRTATSARQLVSDALALQEAGCFSIVLEAVPNIVAKVITDNLNIPTIGIGAGTECSGQVLVYHDVLGLYDNIQPRFVKKYAQLRGLIIEALMTYKEEVSSREFPDETHIYSMKPGEEQSFLESFSN